MKLTIFGSGYVGLVTGACLAESGNEVICFDLNQQKIAQLNDGIIPIFEPRLEALITRAYRRGLIKFTANVDAAMQHGDIHIIAVGTPSDENGSADINYVLTAADNIGQLMQRRSIIITKSTVPVGTGDKVRAIVQAALDRRGVEHEFAVVSNPEFLREGDAIRDFQQPDRVVIGASETWAMDLVKKLYEPFVSSDRPIIEMDLCSAEPAKYAANAMLATRISFMNEMANLAEDLGADIESVRLAIGADPRIGHQYLRPGCGYGGSCFPKDVSALIQTATKDASRTMDILGAVERVNIKQKHLLVEKIMRNFGGDIKGLRFAIWGLAFKPDTDDMREAPAINMIEGLLERGAEVIAFDPVAMPEARRRFGADRRGLTFVDSAIAALLDADALVLVTEWSEFRRVLPSEIAANMKHGIVFDGRNIWNPKEMSNANVKYFSIGRSELTKALCTVHHETASLL